MASGTVYEVFTGGTADGTASGGPYQDGQYTPGTSYITFTASNVLTQVGSGGFRQ